MSESKTSKRDKASKSPEDDEETETQTVEYASLDAFMKDGFKTFMEATRHANAMPTDRDYDFYKTHNSFNQIVQSDSDHILSLINRILHRNDVEDNIKNKTIDEKMELIIEGNDIILERVATTIDEMNGLRKLPTQPIIQTVSAELPVNGSWNRVNKFTVNSSIQNTNAKSIQLLTAKNIIRPQKFFKDKIENSNQYPWKPRITEKPNSLKPLALYLEGTDYNEIYSHSYEVELDHFVPPEHQLKRCTPKKPKLISDTPLHEVSTQTELEQLLEDLRKHTEIAVDLEHHSYRSFMGITCLMQISTIDADYIIDTLALRDKLHILNEVFTRNSVVKIFHGAESDIQWLQRDLSLYVVNMFDTHKAAKQLGYSGLSLAYLMNRFCSFMPNKKFQLADWRIRPLPEELKSYAREDTHYLIYIYHMLKNELLKVGNGSDNILKSVFQASTAVCKLIYVKPRLTETSHLDLYRKCKRLFDNRQMYALKYLYQWRDTIAREEDESTGYILPNHMLLQISEMLPREVQGILACCNPIPPLVRANAVELHQIILRAREQSIEKPIMAEENRSRGAVKESVKLNIDSPLHCPHDLTKLQEFRDDLPTLLGNRKIKNKVSNEKIPIEKVKPLCTVFDTTEDENGNSKVSGLDFLGPYERYKLVKQFIQTTEEEKEKQNEEEMQNNGEKPNEEEKQNREKNNANDDPSVEDRIASLHEHYKQVTKEATAKKRNRSKKSLDPDKSLVEMGGSKKRKRDQSLDSSSYNPAYEVPENPVHTPLPLNKQNVQEHQNTRTNKMSKQQRRREKRKQNFDNEGSPSKKSNSNFKPYDYSSVDYSEFQGGAGRGRHVGQQSNFRGKKKNNYGGKANNKSFTYGSRGGSGRGGRGGRGGGRGHGRGRGK